MQDYLYLVKQHVREDYAVIVIGNSDIAKPASRKLDFSPKCVRTLDRGFDANDYYRYFLKRNERFIIRAKKNRKVIYNGKTCDIMDVALKYKGNYRMDFKDKSGKTINCKMSCIPVKLCEFLAKELTLVAVYGFGAEPMMLK